jgi:DNA invertase Pin-like site-specific DNA recombinase
MALDAFAYVRVSTEQQTAANQLADVRRLAAARGLKIARVWEETESGAKRRPVQEAMLRDLRAGKARALIVWSLDRIGRQMGDTIRLVLELDALNVRLCSVQEGWLDTDGPVRRLLVAIFAWVAEQERARLLERQAAARARLEREGRHWGRPLRISDAQLAAMREARQLGKSVRQIAAAHKCPRATVARALRRPCP